jgi:gas vesicle protein
MEASVSDNSRALAAALVGAVLGGMAGYLFFTPHGRSLRRQFEPAIDDISRELSQLRGTINKAAGVASESWKLLNEALGETGSPRYPTSHQKSPF